MPTVPTPPEEVAVNRAIFLYHLRVNPDNVRQITGSLKKSADAMCAVGLGCDAFEIPMTAYDRAAKGITDIHYDPYGRLAHKLGVGKEVIQSLYSLNDMSGLSFEQVAEAAELYFNSDQTVLPHALWRNHAKETN